VNCCFVSSVLVACFCGSYDHCREGEWIHAHDDLRLVSMAHATKVPLYQAHAPSCLMQSYEVYQMKTVKEQEQRRIGIKAKMQGVFRESNSGPLAPEARIIPLDQTPDLEVRKVLKNLLKHERLVIGLIGYCVLFRHVVW
jgi:hypothetical protein